MLYEIAVTEDDEIFGKCIKRIEHAYWPKSEFDDIALPVPEGDEIAYRKKIQEIVDKIVNEVSKNPLYTFIDINNIDSLAITYQVSRII